MISTVTTAVTTESTTLLSDSLALLTALTLLALLIQKEVISVGQEDRWQRLNRTLNVVIVPLILTCLAIIVVEMTNIL